MGNKRNSKPQSAEGHSTARHLAIVKARNKRIILLTVSLCLLLILAAGIITGLHLLTRQPKDDGLILDNVIVGGVNIGGMTTEDAANAIRLSIEPKLTNQSMIVRLDSDALELKPETTGIELDVEALVDAAFAYGRTGTNAEQNLARAQAKTKEYNIALLPYLRLDFSAIRSAVDNFCAGYSVEMVEPSVTITGERPTYKVNGNNSSATHQILTITMGTPETYLDAADLYYEILDAYSLCTLEFRYEMPVAEEPDKPSAQKIFDTYCTPAVDAILDTKTYEVTDEVYGYGFNVYTLQQRIDTANYGEVLEITLGFLLPDITAKDLTGGLFEDTLVSYTASSIDSSTNRNKNLAIACNAINGLVIKSGETFDLNAVLGPRSADYGYLSAPTFSGSETNIIGGGIDQVASALYYCALRADLAIVNHSFHRYAVEYTPLGTDAAMSNTENLMFTNTTSAPIRILAEATGGKVKITFLGTEDKAYLLDIESVTIAQTVPNITYQSMENDNVYGYEDGDVIQSGLTGYTVETYLCKYNAKTGELISRELLGTVTYESRDIVIIKIESSENMS